MTRVSVPGSQTHHGTGSCALIMFPFLQEIWTSLILLLISSLLLPSKFLITRLTRVRTHFGSWSACRTTPVPPCKAYPMRSCAVPWSLIPTPVYPTINSKSGSPLLLSRYLLVRPQRLERWTRRPRPLSTCWNRFVANRTDIPFPLLEPSFKSFNLLLQPPLLTLLAANTFYPNSHPPRLS